MIPTNPYKAKTQHEAAGGSKIRPRIECIECEGELVLCYGDKVVNPYWRHINSDCGWNGFTGEGESEIHENAKLKLVDALNKGSKIEVSTDCTLCSSLTTDVMPKMHYREEVWVKNEKGICVWDVAGMVDGEVGVGIEVYYSHEATNIDPRSGVWWVELKAESVLNSSELKYNNVRRNQVCFNRVKCDAKMKDIEARIDSLAGRLGYLKNGVWSTFSVKPEMKAWRPFLDFSRCIKCKKISHEVEKWRPMCRPCYQEVFDIDREVFHELAKKLGFFDGKTWKLVERPEEAIKSEFDALLDRKICIVCVRGNSRFFQPSHPPFCDKCFDMVLKPLPPLPPAGGAGELSPASPAPPLPTPIFALDLEKLGYFSNGKWYKTRAKRPMIGKLIQDPSNGLLVWVADAHEKYNIVHRKEIEGRCIRCTGAAETTIDAPYCGLCFEEVEEGSPVRQVCPKPKQEINIETVHMGKALGYYVEDPYEQGRWQWVKEENTVGIMPMPVRVAFEEAGKCIKCNTPTSTITVKNPYCGGCEKEVLAREKVWAKELAEKKRLKKELQMMEDLKKQPWRMEEQKPVVVESWETSKRKQKEEENKKKKAKEKREKEKAKKLDYEIVKQPGTSKIKKVAKQIIEYEKKKGTLENILK